MKVNTPHATCAKDFGISLASNTALHTILRRLSAMVQHLLLVTATTCTPE